MFKVWDLIQVSGWFGVAAIINSLIVIGIIPSIGIIMVFAFLACGFVSSAIFLKYYIWSKNSAENSEWSHPNYYNAEDLQDLNTDYVEIQNNEINYEVPNQEVITELKKIDNIPEGEQFCPKCRELIEEGLTFCPECGRRLRKKYY
ncbi:MAG: hypothetical protein ACFFAH_04905 [Promethearchaeota archaeon]